MAALKFVSQSGNGYFTGTWNRDTAKLRLVCGSMVEAAARVFMDESAGALGVTSASYLWDVEEFYDMMDLEVAEQPLKC